MKIVVTGGTGQVGRLVCEHWLRQGHDLVVVARHTPAPGVLPQGVRFVPWNGVDLGPWATEIDGADVVLNLAGRSVNCRYTATHRQQILDSRVHSTRAVGAAIQGATTPPRTWLQASTATIYAHRFDADNDEEQGKIGGAESTTPGDWKFSIQVAKAWEAAAREGSRPETRLVLLRSAMVMAPGEGGIFDTLLTLVRRRLGGRAGHGRQYVSWIHGDDFCRALDWLIELPLEGVVNLAAPHPIPNADFMRELRDAWGIRLGLPATRWMLTLGAILLRTETELILKSRRVVPGRLLASGFEFDYPTWPAALVRLREQWSRC